MKQKRLLSVASQVSGYPQWFVTAIVHVFSHYVGEVTQVAVGEVMLKRDEKYVAVCGYTN